ncbi:MAG TPA: GNAT family N-acetyltransferase [Patescibacteria group bacterium]|nr:GNAT family N-acetyltransferase [Patescibacteria group bacterium]
MEDIRIELMTTEDLNQVADVFLQVFNALGENWGKESATKHVNENFSGDSHFVAKINNRIIGFIMAIPLTREKGTELFVDSIAILPDYQHKGVGQKLWDKIEESSKDGEYVAIRLLANKQLKSFNWYKSLGYQESGWIELYREL